MNILYIVHKDPRIKTGGNELRTNLIWEILKKKGRVFTLVLNDTQKERYIYINDEEHPICFVNLKKSTSWFKTFLYRLINRVSGLPILPFPLAANRHVTEFYPHDVMDMAVCRYIRSFCYFHLWKVLPTLVDIDDSPKQVYNTVTQYSFPRLLRPIGRWVNQLQTRYVLKKVNGGWISNQDQLEEFGEKVKLLPNIPIKPSASYNPTTERENYLFTIGVMGYPPNFMGVNKFLKEVWPSFHKEYPQIRYIIGGRNAPKDMANRWNATDGVSYVGFVDNLERLYAKCIAAVVPIYAGGGTCIKTLEAMAYSRVCLSTPFGARGILEDDVMPYNGLCIFRNTSDFVSACCKLLDERSRVEMEGGAFRYFHSHYSMNMSIKAVDEVLQQVQQL